MERLTDKNERNIGTFKATEHLLQVNVVRQFFARANWTKHTNMAAINVQFNVNASNRTYLKTPYTYILHWSVPK